MELSGFALLVFPVIVGVLSGSIGVYLLFSIIKAVDRWRGLKTAIIAGMSLNGLIAYIGGGYILGFGDFRGLVITGFIPGIFGILVGGLFAFGIVGAKKSFALLASSLIGFFFGAVFSVHLLFYLFTTPSPKGLLVFGLNYFLGILGGICGAIAGVTVSSKLDHYKKT